METLEIIGVAIGLVYLYWEYRASAWLWLAGVVMPAIYIFVYLEAGFYADMGINIYYLVAGFYGLWYWLKLRGDGKVVHISSTPAHYWIPLATVFSILWLAIWWILVTYTDSTVALGDSLTTALSVVGLWLLSRKYIEQWLIWIIVDVVCAVLYLEKGLAPTGILYALYSIIAIFGYFKWKKLSKSNE